MERAVKQTPKAEAEPSRQTAQAYSAATPALDHLSSQIDNSPYMVAQQKKVEGLFGNVVQLRQDEEEPLQGRFETVQRVEDEEEEMPLQGKFETVQQLGEDDEVSQPKLASDSPVQLGTEPAPKLNNTGLPDNLKTGIESLSGISMDDVRVHYNSSQPASLNALAYAQGTDIHVAPGQEEHLPHEAWHMVQQAQGRVKPTMQAKGRPVNDDLALENEADVLGAKAAQQKIEPVSTSTHCTSAIDDSPSIVTQRQKLQNLFGNTLQLQQQGEETFQGFNTGSAKLLPEPAPKEQRPNFSTTSSVASVDAATVGTSQDVIQRAVPGDGTPFKPVPNTGSYRARGGEDTPFDSRVHTRGRFGFGQNTRYEVFRGYNPTMQGHRITSIRGSHGHQENVEGIQLDHQISWEAISAEMDRKNRDGSGQFYSFWDAKMYYNDLKNLIPALGALNAAAGSRGVAVEPRQNVVIEAAFGAVHQSWMHLQDVMKALNSGGGNTQISDEEMTNILLNIHEALAGLAERLLGPHS